MKAVEFQARVRPDGSLAVPPEVVGQLPPGEPVRVLLLPEPDEEADWARLTAEQFFKGYADSDAAYDDLPGG
jgi:hypothetical protein